MHLNIQQSQDTKICIPLIDQYDEPLIVPDPPLSPAQKETKKFADRYQSRERYHFDSWIEEKTGYNRELMRLYGAKMDISCGIAVPLGTLGNDANKVDHDFKKLPVDVNSVLDEPSETPDFVAKKTRFKNYQLRNQLQKLQIQPKRCQTCASESIGTKSTIYSNIHSGVTQIDNLETCGSVWACPVCRMKILQKRQDQLNYTVNEYKKDNPQSAISLLTFTIPHSKAETLDELKESFLSVFKRLLQSKTWKHFRQFIDGYDRAIEVTWGKKNGWHFHIHMLTYSQQYIDRSYWDYVIRDQWETLVMKYLKKECNSHAFDIRESTKDDYLAKWAGVNELSSGDKKTAKNGNFSISDLENSILKPDLSTVDSVPFQKLVSLLYEYYTVTRGNRLMTHSQTKYRDNKSLRKYYIGDDPSDEEIANISDEEMQSLIPVAEMNPEGMRMLSKNNHIAQLKEVFEQNRVGMGCQAFLNRFPQYFEFIKPVHYKTDLPLFYFYYAVDEDDPFENELYQQEQRQGNLTKLSPGVESESVIVDDIKFIEDVIDKKYTWVESQSDEKAPF